LDGLTDVAVNRVVHREIENELETAVVAVDDGLSPARLDLRITNGSQAEAIINGYHGRFELVFDLAMDNAVYRDIRQSIQGTFRVIGGPTGG